MCTHTGLPSFRPYPAYGVARLAEALTLRGSHDAWLAAVKDGQKAQDETGQLTWEAELRCDTDDHKIALFTQHISTLAAALAELWHRAHPRSRNECVYTEHVL